MRLARAGAVLVNQRSQRLHSEP